MLTIASALNATLLRTIDRGDRHRSLGALTG
jgi:hypothetical protein